MSQKRHMYIERDVHKGIESIGTLLSTAGS